LAALVSAFGAAVAAKFSTGAGEPEDYLRGPLETLVAGLAKLSGLRDVVLAGEDHLAEVRVRPDYAVYVGGALAASAPERWRQAVSNVQTALRRIVDRPRASRRPIPSLGSTMLYPPSRLRLT